ncbi:hypothetical protein K474DRAFT_1647047 [Panus rudis PR-1116 ss-1]|nr:hypothetical protein K474DRAFT_1647047 [Panus rudis PR-1116 ss-1]
MQRTTGRLLYLRTSLPTSASAMPRTRLPPTIRQGILNFPGATPESKAAAERLLEEDRQQHHSLYRAGFHNHLSHHILAAYDLGAPAKLLQTIYDEEKKALRPIRPDGSDTTKAEPINRENWTQYLGPQHDQQYADYLAFFSDEIANIGVGQVLERYLFSPAANGNGTHMLLRFVSGAVHPLIQTGYAVEFGSDAMVAQALAQAAMHDVFAPELYDLKDLSDQSGEKEASADPTHRQPSRGKSLLSILREAYDSDILHPVMPYDPNALLSKRQRDALQGGRPEEIKRLASLWKVDVSKGQQELDDKVEELFWVTTLLLAGTSKVGRTPRLDFFLMHLLNATLFVPSLLNAIPSLESKALLLRALIPVILNYLILRGRPRINPDVLMSYTAVPRPPASQGLPQPDTSALGDLRDDEAYNPWPVIIESVLYAPDAHTVKAIRALYYAAQRYGTTPSGGALGAFQTTGKETHEGIRNVDGTIFVRAAGAVMDVLGWVSYGQKEGSWDRSGLGWDDAWKTGGQ